MKNKKEKNEKVSEISVEPLTKQNSIFKNIRKVSVMVSLAIAVIICAGIAIVTVTAVLAHTSSLKASGAEYDYLRGLAGDIEAETGRHGEAQLGALDIEMRQINPDYVCWIRIDGTNIDYPVVRGSDNEKYINTTFYGEKNKAGAIFMDYRNLGDPIPHIIIYGHNVRQGGMFTDLKKFLNGWFLEENNIITLIINDNEVKFEIFSARLSDIYDPAYNLDLSTPRYFARFADKINAPLKATQIIPLSTCASAGPADERVIVQGYRLFA